MRIKEIVRIGVFFEGPMYGNCPYAGLSRLRCGFGAPNSKRRIVMETHHGTIVSKSDLMQDSGAVVGLRRDPSTQNPKATPSTWALPCPFNVPSVTRESEV